MHLVVWGRESVGDMGAGGMGEWAVGGGGGGGGVLLMREIAHSELLIRSKLELADARRILLDSEKQS